MEASGSIETMSSQALSIDQQQQFFPNFQMNGLMHWTEMTRNILQCLSAIIYLHFNLSYTIAVEGSSRSNSKTMAY